MDKGLMEKLGGEWKGLTVSPIVRVKREDPQFVLNESGVVSPISYGVQSRLGQWHQLLPVVGHFTS